MKLWKILAAISVLFLLMGFVSAFEFEDLALPDGYEEQAPGVYGVNGSDDFILYFGESDANEGAFNSNSNYNVTPIGGNFYYFVDSELNYSGLQEKITIDDVDYLVSVSKIGDQNVNKTMCKDILNEFNKLNNFTPVEA